MNASVQSEESLLQSEVVRLSDTLELYRLVNRSLPDTVLDAYVDQLARRIASFNPAAVAMAKGYRGGIPLQLRGRTRPAKAL